MLAYLRKFVKRLKILLSARGGFEIFNKPKNYLLIANVLLVFFLILLSNVGVLPFEKIEDFGFFAVIFLILALYRPGWSFLFFIGTIALENINLAPESLEIAIRPYQFLGALTILAVLIRLVSRRLNFGLPKINWQDKAIIIFAAAGFISILGATDKSLSLKYSVIIFSFTALYFLARLFIQNLDDVKKILPFFLSSSVVVILYGIWQNVRFMKGLESFETMPGRSNATFAEADWLGMFLVLVLAVVYSLFFYFYKEKDSTRAVICNWKFVIWNKNLIKKLFNLKLVTNYLPTGQAGKLQITNLLLYLLLIACYILLILTVSRSAWLGATVVSIMYLALCIWYFLKDKNIKILWIPACTGMTFAVAFGIIAIFNLTSFELGNRLQSTGSGLQEITVSCVETQLIASLPEAIHDISELQQYNCYHINLEDIEKEKAAGNVIATVYRDDPNINIRSEIYRKSWEEIKKHPILGIGWGSISNILGEDERGAGLNSSNIFLEVWLGAGAIGLIAFVFVWGSIICRNFEFRIFNFDSIFNDKISNKEIERKNLNNSKLSNSEFIQNSKFKIQNWNLFLLLSFFAILIPNLFNAGIMLGFLWVYLAIAQIKQSNNETI